MKNLKFWYLRNVKHRNRVKRDPSLTCLELGQYSERGAWYIQYLGAGKFITLNYID